MYNSILPSDIIYYTSEKILARDFSKGHVIYISVLSFIIMTLILLPILKVTVSVQSNGIIRPVIEKNEIKSLTSGIVESIFIKENQKIKKNKTLLVIDDSVLKRKLQLIEYQQDEQEKFLHDLTLLTSDLSNLSVKVSHLKTIHYRNEYLYFKNQVSENRYNYDKANIKLKRCRALSRDKLLRLSELEEQELEVSKLRFQYEMLFENQSSQWHKELLDCRLKIKELKTEHKRTERERKYAAIKAPVSGTIEQFSGISVGGFIQAGQLLAVISPDSGILAEVYISPRDIGLIHVGTRVNIQVDAFNYHQWGLITATVVTICDDYFTLNGHPHFRIKCKLDRNFLQLKNGYKGFLKKGMTIRARFLITKRSLFQLLYDHIDDWVNPLQTKA